MPPQAHTASGGREPDDAPFRYRKSGGFRPVSTSGFGASFSASSTQPPPNAL